MIELIIRKFEEKDINGILKLFRYAFNKEASEEWFTWKYQNSPWGATGYVTVHNEQVVAFYGGLRMLFDFNGKKLWAYQLCDIMTHPEYRARLISKTPMLVRLGELFYKENIMDFAFGFPSLRHARLQTLRLGGEGYRIVKIYKKENLKSYSLLWKSNVVEGWDSLKRKILDGFIAERKDNILRIVKNYSYIKWRYVEHPLKNYKLLSIKKLYRTIGYIVFVIEDEWINVLDIFYSDEKHIGLLLKSIEAYALNKMNNIKGIKIWSHPYETLSGYLKYLGYAEEDHIPIAFRSVKADSGVNSDIFYNRLFYRMGDYDAS